MATPVGTSVCAQGEAPPLGRWLALGAVLGPAIFILAWFVLGLVSPGFTIWDTVIAPYSPVSASISGLGLGPTGPYMNAAFVASGVLVMAGGIGIFQCLPDLTSRSRRIGSAIVITSGVGLAIDGVFTLETLMPHLMGFLLGIGILLPGFVVIGRMLRRIPRLRRVGTLTLIAGPLTLVLTILYFATFSPTAEGAKVGIAGLTERVLVIEAFVPIVTLGWLAFRGIKAEVKAG
jgi:hypothetical membrane protein